MSHCAECDKVEAETIAKVIAMLVKGRDHCAKQCKSAVEGRKYALAGEKEAMAWVLDDVIGRLVCGEWRRGG